MVITKIEGVKNYYGALHVKEENRKYYMDVACEVNGYKWKEIKKELYNLLIEFNNNKSIEIQDKNKYSIPIYADGIKTSFSFDFKEGDANWRKLMKINSKIPLFINVKTD